MCVHVHTHAKEAKIKSLCHISRACLSIENCYFLLLAMARRYDSEQLPWDSHYLSAPAPGVIYTGTQDQHKLCWHKYVASLDICEGQQYQHAWSLSEATNQRARKKQNKTKMLLFCICHFLFIFAHLACPFSPNCSLLCFADPYIFLLNRKLLGQRVAMEAEKRR